LLAVRLATVLSESGLVGSAGAASAPAVADGAAAVVVGMAAVVTVSGVLGWLQLRFAVYLT
jgi:hypothetical protein